MVCDKHVGQSVYLNLTGDLKMQIRVRDGIHLFLLLLHGDSRLITVDHNEVMTGTGSVDRDGTDSRMRPGKKRGRRSDDDIVLVARQEAPAATLVQ
jgi:hypothetical protein